MVQVNEFFQEEKRVSLAPNIMSLTILPTEQCCFRCDYCYEDFEIGKMPHDVESGVVSLIRSRAESLSLLNLSWFGGEPLMAKDVLYRIAEVALELSKTHGFEFVSNMTTNAYLLDLVTYEKLVDHHVTSFQITLDGEQEAHDNVRKRVDGKGTFDKIMQNLLAIKSSQHQADIVLRLHYTPQNWKGVVRLVGWLKEHLLDDDRFSVMFRAVGKWGGENDEHLEVFEDAQDIASVEKVLVSELLGNIPEASEPNRPYVCYASKANNLVIRANGGIAKCTVALSHQHNDVGKLNADGSLEIYQKNFKKWLIGFQTGDLKQLACPASSALKADTTTLKSIPVVAVAA